MLIIKLITIILGIFVSSLASAEKKVVCYWFSDLVPANQIDPFMCTHIVYSFLGVESDGSLNCDGRSEAEVKEKLDLLNNLKSQNANLKTLVAVGGYNLSLNPKWSSLAANSAARGKFALNVKSFLLNNNLNGVDIDWEFPNYDGSSRQDKENFVLLLNDLKQTLAPSFSLSIAMSSTEWRVNLSYDVNKVFDTCDFVNLMTYDFHGEWESKTGIHTALYRSALDPTNLNVNFFVRYLLDKGVAKEKLIVGIATYGNVFTLNDPHVNGVGAPAKGAGSWKFPTVCQKVQSGELLEVWDDDQKALYAFNGVNWVGYDNVRAVTEKANYINNLDLGGAMFWSIDSDDYNNKCGNGNFPLIKTVSNIVK